MARILIADDTSMIRAAIGLFLEGTHHEIVAEADNGLSALELCIRYIPDVVIMDISMPTLDGIEASRHILQRLPNTYIIILSFYAHAENVKKASQVGVKAFLSKPVLRTRLLEELAKADPTASEEAAESHPTASEEAAESEPAASDEVAESAESEEGAESEPAASDEVAASAAPQGGTESAESEEETESATSSDEIVESAASGQAAESTGSQES